MIDLAALLRCSDDIWCATILCGINCAMYLSEVLKMQRAHVNFESGAYLARRSKTKVRRAAMLWPVTIAAINKLPRRGSSPWIFTSKHGTAYNAKGRWRSFDQLRQAAGIPDVTFDMIRDGGYSAAVGAGGVDLKMAKVLAGHIVDGDTDRYVSRRPEWVQPACDAIWKLYGDAITDALDERDEG